MKDEIGTDDQARVNVDGQRDPRSRHGHARGGLHDVDVDLTAVISAVDGDTTKSAARWTLDFKCSS